MPKTTKTQKKKKEEVTEEEKIINVDTEEKDIDPEIIEAEDEVSLDDEAILDDEEINPFGDKWEE